MLYIATGRNSIGRFYETFGNGGADTRERTLGANQTQRVWYWPNRRSRASTGPCATT